MPGGSSGFRGAAVELATDCFVVLPPRPSDEHHPEVKADGYVDNLAEAVDLLLQHADQ